MMDATEEVYEIRCNYCGTRLGHRRIGEGKIVDDITEGMAEFLRAEEDEEGFMSLVEVMCKTCGIENEILW